MYIFVRKNSSMYEYIQKIVYIYLSKRQVHWRSYVFIQYHSQTVGVYSAENAPMVSIIVNAVLPTVAFPTTTTLYSTIQKNKHIANYVHI